MNTPTGGGDPSQRMLTEIAQLRVKASGRDLLLLRVGALGMLAGPGLAIAGYVMASQAGQNSFIQRDGIVLALIGLTVAVVGAALFLRYSLGEFLRFWMARILAEQSRQAVPTAPVPPTPVAPRRDPGLDPNHPPHVPNGRMAPAPAPAPPPSSTPYGPMTERRPER